MIEVDNPAPNFKALDQNEEERQLLDFRGSWVLLYFYPKDDTPGCTIQACAIRDNWQRFEDEGIVVLGVSADGAASHQKFKSKHELPFILLTDPDKKIINEYGSLVEKSMFGKTYKGISRDSFLINPKGKVVRIYRKVKPATHAEMILKDVSTLKAISK